MPQVVAESEMPTSWQGEHLYLPNVTWDYYQETLEQLGERRLRVSFYRGEMEIMSPLPDHESLSEALASIVRAFTEERRIPRKSYGSSTFGVPAAAAGLEPDKCFYFAHAAAVAGMKRFDPAIHPAPDLAIEVEITRRIVARLPIYRALGVPEIWRHSRGKVEILVLTGDEYRPVPSSLALPGLTAEVIALWSNRLAAEEETQVLAEFRDWCRANP